MKNLFAHPIRLKYAPLVMAWGWSILLVFFPVWLMGSADFSGRLKALLVTLAWVGFSTAGLYFWIRGRSVYDTGSWTAPTETRASRLWMAAAILMGALLNLPTLFYPITSSGDEAYHAAAFRGIGKNLAALVDPLPLAGLAIMGVAVLATVIWAGQRWFKGSIQALHLWLALGALAALWVPLAWLGIDALAGCGLLSGPELLGLVRYQPLGKLLWLPFTLLGWQSLVMLRLPALICWLASAWLLYRAAALHTRNLQALLPGLFLLVMPGMFYYAHLVYLTTPMLLLWCAALYAFEAYEQSEQPRYLILCALALNLGCLLRVETAYFTLGLGLFQGLRLLLRRQLTRVRVIDLAALGWYGASIVPLWGMITPQERGFEFGWQNLVNMPRLLAIAGDFPLQIGLLALALLLWGILAYLVRPQKSCFSPALLGASLVTMLVSYLLYTLDYIVVDERNLGILPIGSEWQTAHRFLVSWSPLITLLMAEGAARLRRPALSWTAAALVGAALLAQATFWPAPFSLPEFTSLNLRPVVEYPHLPAREVAEEVSRLLKAPQQRALAPEMLGAAYHAGESGRGGQWVLLGAAPDGVNSAPSLADYCLENQIDLLALPLVWYDGMSAWQKLGQAALKSERFELLESYEYLGEPAVAIFTLKPVQ